MSKGFKYQIALAILILVPLFAQAKATLRPEWAKKSYYNMPVNESFLGAVAVNATPKNEIDFSLDRKTTNATIQQYDDLVRNYEMRKTYGLTDSQDELNYAAQIGDLSKSLIREVRNTQIRKNLKKAETAALKNEHLKKAAKPIAVATAITAACTGTPVTLRLGQDTELRSTTNVMDKTGQIQFISPEIKGGIDVAVNAPERAKDFVASGEKYRFSLLREVPLIEVTSGLAYGTTTTGLTASVSKQIYDNVTCVVDSTRPVAESQLPAHQETVRVLYGISF